MTNNNIEKQKNILISENLELKEKLFNYIDNLNDEDKNIFREELEKIKDISRGVEANMDFVDMISSLSEHKITLCVNMQNIYGVDIFCDYGGGDPIDFIDLDLENTINFREDMDEDKYDDPEDYLDDLQYTIDEENNFMECKKDFVLIFTLLELYFKK